jgi:hypothetical protein
MWNIGYILAVKCPPVSSTGFAGQQQELLLIINSPAGFSAKRFITHSDWRPNASTTLGAASLVEAMHGGGGGGHSDIDSLKHLLDELRAKHICQQEYGLAIGLAVFLGALVLFELVTAITFSIILHRTEDGGETAKRK